MLKTSFRFPEINLGFVISARGGEGAGHMTPKKSLGARMVGNLTKKKCQIPGGQHGEGGGHGHLWI